MQTTDRQAMPWWLESGPETCEFCQVQYHFEASIFCFDCDRPICPLCVVEIREHATRVCPQCHEEAS